MIVSKCMELYNQHQNPALEHFHYLKTILCTSLQPTPIPTPSSRQLMFYILLLGIFIQTESHNMWSFVSDFFLLAQSFQGSFMLWHGSQYFIHFYGYVIDLYSTV